MLSAFGVDHGEISKVVLRPTALLRKLPKAGKLFGQAGAKPNKGPTMGFKAGQAAGKGTRGAMSAIGTGAGKAASGAGFANLGAKMQGAPVKTGVTTSFIAGAAGYGATGMMKKPKQPTQPGTGV
jgi:hypothetical protein